MQLKSALVLVAVSIGLGAPSAAFAQATHHVLDIRRHASLSASSYSTTDLDNAFSYTSNILDVDVGTGDTDCNVTMDWAANTTYSASLGQLVVDSSSDFDETIAEAPGYVRVIQELLWCAGTNGAFSGCAFLNAETGFVTTGADLNYGDAITGCVIAHEFGHTVGNTHVTDTKNVMRTACEAANERVTSTQCGRYQELVDQNGAASVTEGEGLMAASNERSLGSAASMSSRSGEDEGEDIDYTGIPIEAVARGAFIDSVPVGLDQYYGQREVRRLTEMLEESYWQPRRSQILSLIGLITDGNDADVDAILAARTRDKTVTAAVGIALGYVVHRTENRKALSALLDLSRAGGRSEVAGIMGLGLSGHPEAGATLDLIVTEHEDVLADALVNHEWISEFGLREYYR